MDTNHKKALCAISLELRHTLEGTHDGCGEFQPGDLEHHLNAIGGRRDRLAAWPAEWPTFSMRIKLLARRLTSASALRTGWEQARTVAEFVCGIIYNKSYVVDAVRKEFRTQ